MEHGYLRIGALSDRAGVSPRLLRAWESRYGLLRPTRSPGGYRLYSSHDQRRVEMMRAHLKQGLSAAEAARMVLEHEQTPVIPALEHGARALRVALDSFDEFAAQSALDGLLSAFSVETVAGEVVLPYLRELGHRWQCGEASVAHEHFASQLLRARLLGLARGWDRGTAPRAMLACAPGEQHDLGLITFGLALRARGWRIVFLGPDTPLQTLATAASTLRPDASVVTTYAPARLADQHDGLGRLSETTELWLAGPAATRELAIATRAQLLDLDPLGGAELVATTQAGRLGPFRER